MAVTDSRIESMRRTKLGARGTDLSKVDATAEAFEAQFIAQMMENMFSTVKTNSEFGGGDAEEVYNSMLVTEYGNLIARSGGIGVADHVKREMIRMQEVGHE